MKTLKQPFVLFFLAGMVPTPQELADAGKLRARVGYRNASVVQPEDAPEPCDGVAGAVPPTYKKFPTAEEAIAAYDRKLEEAAKKADAAVGKPPVAKPGPGAGKAPQGFENLPGGDGSLGAPNAAGATPQEAVPGSQANDGKPADDVSKQPPGERTAANAPPAVEAGQKPAAWGSKPAAGKK